MITETKRQSDTHQDKQTNRQKDTQENTETDNCTDTQAKTNAETRTETPLRHRQIDRHTRTRTHAREEGGREAGRGIEEERNHLCDTPTPLSTPKASKQGPSTSNTSSDPSSNSSLLPSPKRMSSDLFWEPKNRMLTWPSVPAPSHAPVLTVTLYLHAEAASVIGREGSWGWSRHKGESLLCKLHGGRSWLRLLLIRRRRLL